MTTSEYHALPELLSLKEVCVITGLNPRTVYKLHDAGKIRSFQVPQGWKQYYKTSLIREDGLAITLTK